ncbi:unnamed protein product [Chrysoparadoxa australica]
MGGSSSRARASQVDFVKDKISSVPVVVFSKTYCPYCTKAKAALNQLGAKYETVELDVVANGSAIQKALADITGRSVRKLHLYLSWDQTKPLPFLRSVKPSKAIAIPSTACNTYGRNPPGYVNPCSPTPLLLARRSVPNVFVSGESIGGGDETAALAQSGQLKPLLEAASAL